VDKRGSRRKWIIWGWVVGALAAGVIVWIAQHRLAEVHVPASANKDGNAIVTGSGPVTVEAYIDFMCLRCRTFHDETAPLLAQLVAENKITLVRHPVAYLDAASTTQYSTRSSAAAGCASDGGRFTEYVNALFAHQPAEGAVGLSNDQLIALGTDSGLDDSFAHCVRGKRYVGWAKKASDDATKAGVTGTPMVFVNGKKVQPTAAALLAAIGAATGPAPTPSGP
jgi:protein-disulfide isomerase